MYDVRQKCLNLLEGDFNDHNFGAAGELLFTPCTLPPDAYEGID